MALSPHGAPAPVALAATPTTPTHAPELRITIWLDQWVEFIGTAAQLRAENLIPDSFEWPPGATDKHWTARGMRYWMRRCRPEGHKGPMSSWLTLDNWFVRISPDNPDPQWHARRSIQRMEAALRREQHHLTPAGARQRHQEWLRIMAALRDQRFQTFKAKLPGLTPPTRGRKAMAATSTHGVDHE